jgi:choline dehydrogenase-like flavoprotein
VTAGVVGPALAEAIAAASLQRLEDPRGFDAIVVGGGASGGMAALQLTRAGLSVLVLDAGWPLDPAAEPLRYLTARFVKSAADPRLQAVLPPKAIALGQRALRFMGKAHQPVQTRCFAWMLAPESFVSDRRRPYVAEPGGVFDWFRAEQLGGRMIIPGHGRQYYRMSEADLHPTDGLSPDWPLAPGELTPWYEAVENLLGLAGGDEDCPWVPSGPMRRVTPNAAEAEAVARVRERWPGVQPLLGRSAEPLNSLEMAAETGRLACRRGAVASEVCFDRGGSAKGVCWYDRATRSLRMARAPLVFLCASALESTRILLASRAATGGIGERSDALGRYLMDHVILSAEGEGPGLPGEPVADEPGRCMYLPRFDLREGTGAASRGYGMQIYRWSTGRGRSYFNCVSFAEMTPNAENRVSLDPDRRDAFGLPVLRIQCRHTEAELRQATDQAKALRELGDLFDVRFHRLLTAPAAPGTAIHECGTARMGGDPKSSVLDPFNQCWDVRGLYVTDGAAFPSQGAQNPTLTILALTARACAHAVGAGRPEPRRETALTSGSTESSTLV